MAKSQANNKKRKAEEPESPDVSSESEEEGMHVVGEGDESSSDEASDEEVEEVAPDETEFAVASGVDVDLILPSPKSTGKYVNKQRCLVLSSRGGEHRWIWLVLVWYGGLFVWALCSFSFVSCPFLRLLRLLRPLNPPPPSSHHSHARFACPQSHSASATFSRTSVP